MQTNLADFIKDTPEGREADAILRSCVHCGFCNATCPTYQLLGDELDGPRGRIYLIKQMLEGFAVTRRTQVHLDRCLSCRSCETTCPSGVNYHRLLDIGRGLIDQRVARPFLEEATRRMLGATLTNPLLLKTAVDVGQWFRPLLPTALSDKLPEIAPRDQARLRKPPRPHQRRMIAFASCGQAAFTPNTRIATTRVLDRLGIELFEVGTAGCCGALRYHLGAQEQALEDMRRVIDSLWPHVEGIQSAGVEAIVMTASGCGVHLCAYGELLGHDPAYAGKAARISELTLDISEVLVAEQERLAELLRLSDKTETAVGRRVAFHSPCTLQHGQKIRGVVESLLAAAGYDLTPVVDAHLCCGSAGTYSITQPELSRRLRDNKLAALAQGVPSVYVTANIGCQTHLQSGTATPVRHWIELIDERIGQ